MKWQTQHMELATLHAALQPHPPDLTRWLDGYEIAFDLAEEADDIDEMAGKLIRSFEETTADVCRECRRLIAQISIFDGLNAIHLLEETSSTIEALATRLTSLLKRAHALLPGRSASLRELEGDVDENFSRMRSEVARVTNIVRSREASNSVLAALNACEVEEPDDFDTALLEGYFETAPDFVVFEPKSA